MIIHSNLGIDYTGSISIGKKKGKGRPPGVGRPSGKGNGLTPEDITTELWLDASDDTTITLSGSDVTQWRDKSGNGYHANSGGIDPTYNLGAVNSLNTVNFAVNDFLDVSQNFTQPITIFSVQSAVAGKVYSSAGTTAVHLVNSSDKPVAYAGANLLGTTTGFSSTTSLVVVEFNTTNSVLYRDGISEATGNIGSLNTASGFRIGNQPNKFNGAQGDICEIVIVLGVADEGTRTGLTDYFKDKWGIV